MIKSLAYLRVSGKGQVRGHGYSRQLEAVNAFAKKNGYSIEGIFKETGISGVFDEKHRPAFAEMVRELLTNGVRTVLVESLDRLAREYRIQEQLLIYLASKGVELVSVATGENTTKAIQNDPMKKALIQIQGVFAELDKSLLVRKLRKAREAIRKAEGKCEGRKKYGEDDPEEQAIIKRIYYLRRKSRGAVKRRSYQNIAEILNSESIPTKAGKQWTATQVWRIANHK